MSQYALKRKELNKSKQELADNLKISISIEKLNMILSFIHKDSVLNTKKALINIRKLFQKLDMTEIHANKELDARVWFINKSLDARINENFDRVDYIKELCYEDPECDEFKHKLIENFKPEINYKESKWILSTVNDMLAFGYTVNIKDAMLDILNSMDSGDCKSYKEMQDGLYDIATKLISIKRSMTSAMGEREFSLDEEYMNSAIEASVNALKDRNRVFITGIKRWNTLLSPGYIGGKIYTYIATPGGGKSTILLKSALDIKRYNHGIKTRDPDKKPAVLFLNLENELAETIERIYNMEVDSDDIRNYTPIQVYSKFRDVGKLKLTKDDNINIIIRGYKNRELETDDLYSLIDDYADEGTEIIALVIDYMKRIRPSEPAKDEKYELKNITNEFKEIAKFYNIPVISAQQVNRDGASVIDAAVQAKKGDVAKLIGRDKIAGAWEIIENSDCVILINKELVPEKNGKEKLYLSFKLLKRRYKSTEPTDALRRLEYFAHPFDDGNDIKLKDDTLIAKSLSVLSLNTQFDVRNVSAQDESTGWHKKKEKKSKYTKDEEDEFDPFDLDQQTVQF